MSKTYLGDGAYAELQPGELILTTEDGITVQNRIVLDSGVLAALLDFLFRDARTFMDQQCRMRIESRAQGQRDAMIVLLEAEYETSLRLKDTANRLADTPGATAHDFVGRVLSTIIAKVRAL